MYLESKEGIPPPTNVFSHLELRPSVHSIGITLIPYTQSQMAADILIANNIITATYSLTMTIDGEAINSDLADYYSR